ncbi:MAG: cation:proton antiporter [Eubacteriales bacterium]|nr:cation:proton antiporter [Eubacteriales bacterium]
MPGLLIRWGIVVVIAFLIGKGVSKLRLPAILGWLIAGMVLGPYALGILPDELVNAGWYQNIIHVLECAVGFMIGTELVWKKIKNYGKALILTTLAQSLGTFLLVSGVFSVIFVLRDIPVYLAFLFGGIALATAPAPALSIVQEFKTQGDVTKTLIPMAALDDMVGVAVFFTTVAVVSRQISGNGMPLYMIPVMIVLPILIGILTGVPAGRLLKKDRTTPQTIMILMGMITVTACIGYFCNMYLMPSPLLNYMLMGMAFSATFSNMVTEERLQRIVVDFNPLLGIFMIVVILNLGAPLDYHAILGAGVYTVVYIVVRAFGKYFGARLGAKATHMPITVQKYLGFTLLPHSGVSLVFTGIAVSALMGTAPECAEIIQGTIAAAAVINEIIAVIVAKKGFEWAGEMPVQ